MPLKSFHSCTWTVPVIARLLAASVSSAIVSTCYAYPPSIGQQACQHLHDDAEECALRLAGTFSRRRQRAASWHLSWTRQWPGRRHPPPPAQRSRAKRSAGRAALQRPLTASPAAPAAGADTADAARKALMAVMGEAEGCGHLALSLIMQKARAPAKEVGTSIASCRPRPVKSCPRLYTRPACSSSL